MRFNADTAVSF